MIYKQEEELLKGRSATNTSTEEQRNTEIAVSVAEAGPNVEGTFLPLVIPRVVRATFSHAPRAIFGSPTESDLDSS